MLPPTLVDHLEELFAIRIEFQAALANLTLFDFDIDGRQVAGEDQEADPIREALEFTLWISRTSRCAAFRLPFPTTGRSFLRGETEQGIEVPTPKDIP